MHALAGALRQAARYDWRRRVRGVIRHGRVTCRRATCRVACRAAAVLLGVLTALTPLAAQEPADTPAVTVTVLDPTGEIGRAHV